MKRTIKQARQMIFDMDSGTAISEYFIRQLVKAKVINSHMAGTKAIIDFYELCEYLKIDYKEK